MKDNLFIVAMLILLCTAIGHGIMNFNAYLHYEPQDCKDDVACTGYETVFKLGHYFWIADLMVVIIISISLSMEAKLRFSRRKI